MFYYSTVCRGYGGNDAVISLVFFISIVETVFFSRPRSPIINVPKFFIKIEVVFDLDPYDLCVCKKSDSIA